MKRLLPIVSIARIITACPAHQNFGPQFLYGHYQNIEDTSLYFSIGLTPVGEDEIHKILFIYSVGDSIYDSFYETEREYDSKKNQSLITTIDGQYLMIHQITDTNIEVYGPSNSLDDLQSVMHEYQRLPDDVQIFPESILFP